MRALITGISGFAGSHLAEYLLRQQGVQVIGVFHGERNNASHLLGRIEPEWLDLTDPERTRQMLKERAPDQIYHLAAQAFVPESWEHPWATLANNIRAEVNLLYAAAELKLAGRILVVASNEEYGRVRPEDLPIDEETPLRPDSPYGVSKISQDFLGLQYFLSHNLQVIRMRAFNHIGPRQDARFAAPSFARQIAEIEAGKREPVIRVGNLQTQRDFTDVRDIVRGYGLALEKGTPGEVYNIGSGKPCAVRELLDGLLEFARTECRVEQDPDRMRPSDTPISYCNPGKFVRQTGWKPEIPREQTLRDILDDARARLGRGER